MTAPTPVRELASIQCLRGAAALLVVLFHAQGAVLLRYPQDPGWLNGFFRLRDFGVVGVDLFFVVSGFIMFHVYREPFGMPGAAADFLRRRMIRIAPLYWILSAGLVFALWAAPGAFSTLRFDARHAVESLLFIPTRNSAGEHLPVLAVGWTLSYELYFYLLFALTLRTSPSFSLALLGMWFSGSAIWGAVHPAASPTGEMLGSDLLVEFVLGGIVAQALASGRILAPAAARAVIALAMLTLAAQVGTGFVPGGHLPGRGIPAFLLVAGLVSLEVRASLRSPAWLARIGDASYSLYLTHILVIAVFFKASVAWGMPRWIAPDALVAFAIGASIATAHLCHRHLEEPMLRVLRGCHRKPAAPQTRRPESV